MAPPAATPPTDDKAATFFVSSKNDLVFFSLGVVKPCDRFAFCVTMEDITVGQDVRYSRKMMSIFFMLALVTFIGSVPVSTHIISTSYTLA